MALALIVPKRYSIQNPIKSVHRNMVLLHRVGSEIKSLVTSDKIIPDATNRCTQSSFIYLKTGA